MPFGESIVACNRFEDAPRVRAAAEQARFDEARSVGPQRQSAQDALLLADFPRLE